ncbi:uncharacterized protein LOC130796444 [Actinidia eriantha]|uniref:uncharacterized protein LOC130796444 n=1 Tax=Actinidia eriantha TaxID=165200 RepID=UPI0025907A35|nr:uncharacterized protein LOC130796444 [Actinidia eriantha]
MTLSTIHEVFKSHDSTEMEELIKLDKETGLEEENILQVDSDACLVDCEMMPELVIFPKESSYQIVKDICINKETPSECSIENCELDHYVISSLLNSDLETENKSTKEAWITRSESSSEHNCVEDFLERCDSVNSRVEHKGHFDATEKSTCEMSVSLRVSSQTFDRGESSVSAIGPVLGPISNSGRTLYCGSISLQSNSNRFFFPLARTSKLDHTNSTTSTIEAIQKLLF